MKEQVRQLWKTCFDDTDEFIDLYMNKKYSEEVSLTIQDNRGKVVSAMQALPYPMTFCGGELMTSYISGACTLPACRSKGLMRQLLQKGFDKMRKDGTPLSTLIPAEPWLFDYYRKVGYAPVFSRSRTVWDASALRSAAGREQVYTGSGFDEKAYRFLNGHMRQRPCCVQHTEDDYRIVLEDLSISGGTTLLTRENGEITGLALALPEEGTLRVIEIFVSRPELTASLLLKGCEMYHCPKATITRPATDDGTARPWGMARIIDAEAILRIYAARYPEKEISITLRDTQIPANDGYYRVGNGACIRESESPPAACRGMGIDELTEWVFLPERAYMSLMLD